MHYGITTEFPSTYITYPPSQLPVPVKYMQLLTIQSPKKGTDSKVCTIHASSGVGNSNSQSFSLLTAALKLNTVLSCVSQYFDDFVKNKRNIHEV